MKKSILSVTIGILLWCMTPTIMAEKDTTPLWKKFQTAYREYGHKARAMYDDIKHQVQVAGLPALKQQAVIYGPYITISLATYGLLQLALDIPVLTLPLKVVPKCIVNAACLGISVATGIAAYILLDGKVLINSALIR